MPRVQNPSLGPGQAPMLVSTVSLTAAQISTLATTPVTLVPAPGAGLLALPLGVFYAYKFGTKAFLLATGGTDTVILGYPAGPSNLAANTPSGLLSTANTWIYGATLTGPSPLLPGDDNAPAQISALSNYNNGPIATATLGAGGSGYVANDTGTITTGSADATYTVLTVGAGGAVLTFQITGAGTSYAVGNLQATARGGAQPGVGINFTVDVTAVTQGDGTLKVTTYYQVIAVP